jgi:hypothetical protein
MVQENGGERITWQGASWIGVVASIAVIIVRWTEQVRVEWMTRNMDILTWKQVRMNFINMAIKKITLEVEAFL